VRTDQRKLRNILNILYIRSTYSVPSMKSSKRVSVMDSGIKQGCFFAASIQSRILAAWILSLLASPWNILSGSAQCGAIAYSVCEKQRHVNMYYMHS
jgi:hypothetical protein